MAQTNRTRIDKGLAMLREGLTPFVETQLKGRLGEGWLKKVNERRRHPVRVSKAGKVEWDPSALLEVMLDHWTEAFMDILDEKAHKSWVHELKDLRNRHAHEGETSFTYDETYRALNTMRLLLQVISAAEQAREVQRFEDEVLRVKQTEQARNQTRLPIEGQAESGLLPWREIITPHPDVSSGRFTQAEFAADLDQVHRGEGADEYRDPAEFFRRTYLTEGLRHLLTGAVRHLAGKGADPVVQLQTNFGGGKTHSMLALYHLFSGAKVADLVGVDDLVRDEGLAVLPKTRRVVLVGTAMSPGQSRTKPDGTVVCTMWGELAWQLGGKQAFAMLAESDKNGTSPGKQILIEMFRKYSPCLILIDEWVAFARQLYHVSTLPAGSFDANLSFTQSLTEAASAVEKTLVVASLPASRIEIGGEGGVEALKRLSHTFSRVNATWRPASAEEGFEIVRRRLFEPLPVQNMPARDAVLRAFEKMYGQNPSDFPKGCGETEYRRRLEKAYPIHPALFDDLHDAWSTLDRFQRTRGVLRLMAAVIYALWEQQDRHVLIFPASVPLDNSAVRDELMNYLEDRWDAIVTKDVDGPGALSLAIDRENPNYGRYSAARRVARSIFMGTAPTSKAAHPGVDARKIKLGCVQPGESPATFGDALHKLSEQATFLYADGERYWFDTQASVNRLADDRAAQFEADDVQGELVEWLRKQRERGDFAGVHIAPESSADVPDEMECRLVILGPEHIHERKGDVSVARIAAEEYLAKRGSAPRLYRNMLVFLVPDGKKLEDLLQTVRRAMAWRSIVEEKDGLNLTQFSARQAEAKLKDAEKAVQLQIPEVWAWCLVPRQEAATAAVQWEEYRLQGDQPLAKRASQRMTKEEQLMTELGAGRLGLELRRLLWETLPHVGTKKLWEYFASYAYLPRLRDVRVLQFAIEKGVGGTVPCEDFGYAERYDDEQKRYVGLRTRGGGAVVIDSLSVVVRPDVAKKCEYPAEADVGGGAEQVKNGGGKGGSGAALGTGGPGMEPPRPPAPVMRRFHGAVELKPDRVGRDAGQIAEEVIQHLQALAGADVRVTLEIAADLPTGADPDTIRTVTENCKTLKFDSSGFEKE